MSNYLAIATVTAALREVLQPVVGQAVTGAQVLFNRPDGGSGTPPAPTVNVYLYQVTPNTAFRNADLPTRRADGTVALRPQAALDLHYLFTFHGNDGNLEPQLLLGAVTSTLHAQPLLSPPAIAKALADFTFLQGSDLADQVELVKFTPTSLSLEEFSKLWSVFFQIEYTLSAAYQASVVLIESGDQPAPALPVQARNLYVLPFRQPQVSSVIPQTGAGQPIVAGGTLLIQGQQLQGETTLVLIENQELVPANVTDAQVTLPLPASVHAGLKGLQIVQKMQMGTPATPHRGVESNVAPFVLLPTITGSSAVAAAGVTTVTLNVAPNIGAGQRAVLLLNNLTVSPPLEFTSAPAISASDSNQVRIGIAGVPTGSYLCRVQIDGAESLLTMNASNQFTGPTVAMP
jgi:Pvc16 N-terminal domain